MSTLPGLASRGDDLFHRIESIVEFLDGAWKVPGLRTRVGADAILGLVPVVGDLLPAALSGYVVWAGAKLGVPKHVVVRMVFNIVVDVVVGSIPILGDAFDFFWKSNQKNLRLIRRHRRA